MSCVHYLLLYGGRDRHGDSRPLAFVTLDVDRSAECEDSFPQAEEPERPRALDFVVPYAPPIVLDTERECSLTFRKGHVHAGGIRVACDVGEQFLENPEEGRRALLVRVGEVARDAHHAADAGAPLELARLPIEGGREA